MRRFQIAFSFLAALVVVQALARTVDAQVQVPFNGSLEGMRVSLVPLTPPYQLATVSITGNATQLGEFELVISAIVNPQAMSAIGTFEFLAANGDTLSAEFTGTGTLTEIPGVILQVEDATITGGTGRFAGATGSFRAERLFDRNTLLTVGAFEGTISTPKP
jgi:hypothetical protein